MSKIPAHLGCPSGVVWMLSGAYLWVEIELA